MGSESNSSSTVTTSVFSPPIITISAHHHVPVKLTNTNYTSWRASLMAILNGYNLIGYIDGTKPCPAEGDATRPQWHQQDQLILAAIFASTSPEILPMISTCTTAASAWETLSRMFASKSRSRVNQLKTDLARASIGSRSISEFMHFLKAKADELALIDQPVRNDDLTLYVVNGLGHAYRDIVGAICARETPYRFEELHDKLVEHELYLKTLESDNSALVATANNAQNSSRNQSSNSRNYQGNRTNNSNHGKGRGNNSSNYQQNRGRGRGSPNFGSRQPVYCQICGHQGHTAPYCRKLQPTAQVA